MSDGLVKGRATPLYGNQLNNRQKVKKDSSNEKAFQQLVRDMQTRTEDETVKVSSHAQSRIENRKIEMNPDRMTTLNEVLTQAKDKGAKSTLAVFGEDAFILSVKDRTVVTALKENEMESRFFTNIDSVYIKK